MSVVVVDEHCLWVASVSGVGEGSVSDGEEQSHSKIVAAGGRRQRTQRGTEVVVEGPGRRWRALCSSGTSLYPKIQSQRRGSALMGFFGCPRLNVLSIF